MVSSNVRADCQSHRTVRIDVIASVLNVILNDENRTRRPILALRYRFNHLTQRRIILRNHRRRGQLANPRSAGVIVRQMHGDELWQVIFSFKLL